MFERFTERARQVVVLAQEEARSLGHNYIGTEHILLALTSENDGVATRILLDCLATPEKVRNTVLRVLAMAPPVFPTPRETLTGIDWEMGYAYVLVHARKIRV